MFPRLQNIYIITTNETIHGTQWQDLPFYKCGVPLVADMSSDILSRVIDFNKFDLIYAGAQKNMGAAGVNLVVVNKNILGKVNRSIPTIWITVIILKKAVHAEYTSCICRLCLPCLRCAG